MFALRSGVMPSLMSSSSSLPATRIEGVDGLRAFAVVLVVIYHLAIPGVFEAGFLGVDIFFVISGFVITKGLLESIHRHGAIDLFGFYHRRIQRLLPATLALIVVAVRVTWAIDPEAGWRTLADAPAAFAYVSNWWQILSKQSYFDTFGMPPVLRHLWTLAVEMQFYLLWPLLVVLALKLGRMGSGAIAILAMVIALGSSLWMTQFADQGIAAMNRAYLGTDTHAAGLLVGCALAALLDRWGRDPMPSASRGIRVSVQLVGIGSAVGLGLLAWHWNEASPTLYLGGFILVALLSAALIAASLDEKSWLARSLRLAPLQWLGLRSYSIYLWHWPILMWVRLAPGDHYEGMPLTLIKLVATGVVAEVSWRLFEPGPQGRRSRVATALGPAAASGFLVAGACLGAAVLLMAWMKPDFSEDPVPVQAPAHVGPIASPGARPDAQPTGVQAAAAEASGSDAADSARESVPGHQITAIGDSVLLGAKGHFESVLPGMVVDAKVGRQFSEGRALIAQLKAQGQIGRIVIIHLGTNGYINEPDLEKVLSLLSDRSTVLLIDVYAKRRWTDQNNELIQRVGGAFPNVRLVRWSAIAENRKEFFAADGIHLTGSGIAALVQAIGQAAQISIPEISTTPRPRASMRPPKASEPESQPPSDSAARSQQPSADGPDPKAKEGVRGSEL